MEKQEDNEFNYFNGFCESAVELALSKGSLCMNRTIIENLSLKERLEWIAVQKQTINDLIIGLDRPDYFLNRTNTPKLFELFKREGNLANEQELNKLEQILICSEESKQLEAMHLETSMLEYLANKKKKHPGSSRARDHEITTLTYNSVLGKLDESIHIVKHPTTLGDLSRMFSSQDWSEMKIQIHLLCQTNEFKCMIDGLPPNNIASVYANVEKCGLFFSKKGNPIKAHCLTTSTYEKLKTREKIQKILSEGFKNYGHH